MNRKRPYNNGYLWRYAGLASQLLVAIGLAVFIGFEGDKKLNSSPLLVSILPLIVLIIIFYKLIKDTENPKKNAKK
ncbi:MAG: AtpZ/AtpI family protein [Bacteroidetes bacterium]|nr:AtpZ/AtpI family protein [Bacteroidota bacterium]